MTPTTPHNNEALEACPFCKADLKLEKSGSHYTHGRDESKPCPLDGLGWATESEAIKLWPKAETASDEEAPAEIWIDRYPFTNWSSTEDQAKYKSEIGGSGKPPVKYTRANQRASEAPPTAQGVEMVKQTVTGENGNCMSACLATVLGMRIDDVPNFHDTAKNSEDWWLQIREWLARKNLGIVSITYDQETLNRIGGMLIVSGMSPRGRRHATVWHKGVMINDPHPDNTGVEPDTIDLIFSLIPALTHPREQQRVDEGEPVAYMTVGNTGKTTFWQKESDAIWEAQEAGGYVMPLQTITRQSSGREEGESHD